MVELLGVNGCSINDFAGAADQAKRYLRRKLSSLHCKKVVVGSQPLLYSLLPPNHDHNIQHLVTRLLVFSPVRYCARDKVWRVNREYEYWMLFLDIVYGVKTSGLGFLVSDVG